MSIILSALIAFGASAPAQLQLPPACTGPAYECTRALQYPYRYGGSVTNTVPADPTPPPPLGYAPFASEQELLDNRIAGLEIYLPGTFPPQFYTFCEVHWDQPQSDFVSDFPGSLRPNGFLPESELRPNGYPYTYTAHFIGGPGTCEVHNSNGIGEGRSAPVYCPLGWSGPYVDGVIGPYCSRSKVLPSPTICTKCGNPIDPFLKIKLQREVDFSTDGLLRLERLYRSDGFALPAGGGVPPQSFGPLWRSSYERQLVEGRKDSSTLVAQLARPDGQTFFFTEGAISIVGSPDSPGDLKRIFNASNTPIGWSYQSPENEIETYDATGLLTHIDHRDGRYVAITHDANGRLLTATDERGRSLQFAHDTLSRVSSVTLPDGNVVSYAYNEGNAITAVNLPGTASRHYGYDDPNSFFLLTSIIDEKGVAYALFTFQSNGNPLTTSHVGGVEQVQVDPSEPATYTDALGTRHTFTIQTIANASRPSAETKSCAGCQTLTKSVAYNSTTGNVDWAIDYNGNKTTYLYDATRFFETSRTEASTDTSSPSIKRTTDTAWNPNFRVPDQRSVKNASGTTEALTKWTYNTRGQAIARCEIDPNISGASSYNCGSATNAPVGVRQSSTTYCEQADITAGTCPLIGLVKSTNGTRLTTDAGMASGDDVTTYTYYATDDATCATGGGCPHRHGDLWKVTNALGQVSETVSYDKNGRVTRMKDANGTYTDLVYHPRGWLTDRIVRANATGTPGAGDATMHIDYDAVGNVMKVTQPDGVFLAYTYDDAHRLTDITDPLSNRIHYTLDAAGNRTKEDIYNSTYDPAHPAQGLKREIARFYDALSHLQEMRNAQNVRTLTYQNPADMPPAGTNYTNGYDGNGNAVYSVDGNNVGTFQQYDPLNRLIQTKQDHTAQSATTADANTQYAYDARDNLRQVTDPDLLNTVYDYDGLNNLTGLHSPDTGFTSYIPDAAGNRISQTDNRGQVSTYTYDALNRLTAIAYVGATGLNVSYAYDQADAMTGCSGSFPKGRLTTMTDASGSTRYCYDRRGNVAKKVQATGTVTLATQYTYTIADRLASMTYPSGARVAYSRDVHGRINSLTWGANAGARNSTVIKSATYYPFGPLNTLTFGNGRTQTRTYDQDYAIDAITGTAAGALTLDVSVDVMGNITNASGTLNPTTPDRRYLYDPLYRLTTAQTGAIPPGPLEAYTYDKTGDRMSAALNGGVAQNYTYTPLTHRLASVGGTPRTVDANGNTQTGTAAGLTLSYDARNRLSAMAKGNASAFYNYNGRGERVAKQNNPPLGQATNLIYAYNESGQLLGEYGSAQVEYVYLDSIPVAVIKAGVIYTIETDHLGTPRQVIDATRNVAVWKWDSLGNAFGAGAPNEDPDGDGTPFGFNLRFPGQYYDQETGLNYNYFRDYESSTGRYVESDPIGLSGGINTYSYVGAKPLALTDPYGLAECGTDCCANIPWPQKEGGTVGGTTRCCGGKAVACVNPNICDGLSPAACAVVKRCALRHERYHVDHHTNCSGQPDGPAPPSDKNANECEAYRDEVKCFSITSCNGSTTCEAEIRLLQNKNRNQRNSYCSLAGM